MNGLKRILLLTPLFILACAESANQNSIEDGVGIIGKVEKVLPQDQFNDPNGFIVQLTSYGSDVSNCTGSLIAPDTVLTAGHCVDSFRPGDVFIGPAGLKNATPENRFSIKEIYIHPQYDFHKAESADIAVLKLDRPAKYKTIPLGNSQFEDSQLPIEATILGWGSTSIGEFTPPEKLLKAETSVYSAKECQKKYSEVFSFDIENTLCVNSSKSSANVCKGDSGGPLIVYDAKTKEPSLIGVAKWTTGCRESAPISSAGYASISSYKDWILNVKPKTRGLVVDGVALTEAPKSIIPYLDEAYRVSAELVDLKDGKDIYTADTEGKIVLIERGSQYLELLLDGVRKRSLGVILYEQREDVFEDIWSSRRGTSGVRNAVISRENGLKLVEKLKEGPVTVEIINE